MSSTSGSYYYTGVDVTSIESKAARPMLAPKVEDGGAEPDWALGPGSVTWKVLADPAVFLVGLLREAMLLTLHPDFAAAAVDHDSFGDDPVMRFRHIAMYTYGATYGTKAEAEKYSSMVRRTHKRIVGEEPMTGLRYQAEAEYELVLTQVMLVDSFLAAYEALNGPLSGAQRDQFVQEQKAPAALLGVNPAHMPSTYGESVDFLAHARQKFAAGLQAREILEPFSRTAYPAGTVIGDLPGYQQVPAMFALRAMTDMAMMTMTPEERKLIAIDRGPKLRSKVAVRASYRLLSKFMRSERGEQIWRDFVKDSVATIVERARAAEAAPGGRTRISQFVVPDAEEFLVELPDLIRNWPGSTADYRVGTTFRANEAERLRSAK
jgi:uncharacterized protein (DUF2236 family)